MRPFRLARAPYSCRKNGVPRLTSICVKGDGKVVARIVPDHDEEEAARRRLLSLRRKIEIGDLISPTGERWDADSDPA